MPFLPLLRFLCGLWPSFHWCSIHIYCFMNIDSPLHLKDKPVHRRRWSFHCVVKFVLLMRCWRLCIQAHRAASTVICLLHAVSIGYWNDMNLINWVCQYSLFNFQRHLRGSVYSFKCLAGFSREAIRCRDRFSVTRTLVTSSMSLFIFLPSSFLFSHGLVLLGYVGVGTHPFLSDNLIFWHIIALTLLRFFILLWYQV